MPTDLRSEIRARLLLAGGNLRDLAVTADWSYGKLTQKLGGFAPMTEQERAEIMSALDAITRPQPPEPEA